MIIKYEGSVRAGHGEWFEAEVIRLDTNESIYVELWTKDVKAEERELIYPGSLFYWTLEVPTEEVSKAGFSTIEFRR